MSRAPAARRPRGPPRGDLTGRASLRAARDLRRLAVLDLMTPCRAALSRIEQYFLNNSWLLALSPPATVSKKLLRVSAIRARTARLVILRPSACLALFTAPLMLAIFDSAGCFPLIQDRRS